MGVDETFMGTFVNCIEAVVTTVLGAKISQNGNGDETLVWQRICEAALLGGLCFPETEFEYRKILLRN